ncbi:MAG: multicopper oxidase family protein [Burkholderiales bacterium]|nr:multicopper oxidase family protein [Burkholderiales bacterium]
MDSTRRRFLQTAAAGLGASVLPQAQAARATTQLTAGVLMQQVRAAGPRTTAWGFNGSVPGPALRFRQGEDAVIRVHNRLPQSTTVHWHGLRVPNAMDGVPQVTQPPIEPKDEFLYGFRCEDAGTYWYHPHQSSFEQVPRGLYGAFIVQEAKPLPVDREVVWVISDFKLDGRNQQVEDFGRVVDFGSGGRLGNTIAINGKAAGAHQRLQVRPNERVRLRLVNASSARLFLLDFAGHEPWVVSYDGQSVEPHPLREPLLMGGGQRTDLVIDGTAGRGEFAIMDKRDKGTRLATIAYAGKAVRARPLGKPAAIQPNRHVEPNLTTATQHFIVFEGGVLGMPAIAAIDGKKLDVKTIMEHHGLSWTMNYTAQHEHAMMHEPLFRFRKDEHAVIRMINRTDFEHPMHLHGHFFQVVAVDGRAVPQRIWRDTVVMAPRQEMDIAFVAENVGEWMFHCHILDHSAGGMMGTIGVE